MESHLADKKSQLHLKLSFTTETQKEGMIDHKSDKNVGAPCESEIN